LVRESGSTERVMTAPVDSYTKELLASSRIGHGAS
jgi:ABC-type microcin C transport system duplicated ATPase subunit YejF